MILIYLLLIDIIYGAENCPGCNSGSGCLNWCQRFNDNCGQPGGLADVNWDSCKTAQDAANNNNLCAVRRDGSGNKCNLCPKALCEFAHDDTNGETCPNCAGHNDCLNNECQKFDGWGCHLVESAGGDSFAQTWDLCKLICKQDNNICAVRDNNKNCYCCSKEVCNAPRADAEYKEQCPNCGSNDKCITQCDATDENENVQNYLTQELGVTHLKCVRVPPKNIEIKVPSYSIGYENKKTPEVYINNDVYFAEYSWDACVEAAETADIMLGGTGSDFLCPVRKNNGRCFICSREICKFDSCDLVGHVLFPCDDFVGRDCGVPCPKAAKSKSINNIYENYDIDHYNDDDVYYYKLIIVGLAIVILICMYIGLVFCINSYKKNKSKQKYNKVNMNLTDHDDEETENENKPFNIQ